MTKYRDIKEVAYDNIVDSGTEGTKVATGTTAQRGSTQGQFRYNTTTGLAEYYTGTIFKSIDSPPSVTSVSPTNPNGSGVTVTVTGTNFNTLGTTVVKFIDGAGTELTGTSVSVTNDTTLTVVTPSLVGTNAPYDVKVENPSGLSASGIDLISVGASPVFTTAADTNVGSIDEGTSDYSSFTTMAATDADGDTITYSATGLPTGVTMNSSTAVLSGTAPSVDTDTNYTIAVTATDAKLNATSRNFLMTVSDVVRLSATGGTITTDGDYKVHTFNNSSNFVVSQVGTGTENTSVQYLVVAGGGGGGGGNAADGNHCAGGGGGAGGMRYNNTNDFTVSASTYAITVGGGGAGGNGQSKGTSGNTSTFSTISSSGGGGGGSSQSQNGINGGSGGGAGNDFTSGDNGGNGNSGGYTPAEGNSGGNTTGGGGNAGSGGGGAHGNAGQNGTTSGGGTGGNGTASNITGSSVTYAGGGGGGDYSNSSFAGGNGGGGQASTSPQSGTDNLGGGGGGVCEPDGSASQGGSGGKGVVILRYKFQ
tara:strand:+ start:1237 stop:2838 length:1602 start_codon:yes stop_codon:yes gene_type:complete